MDSINGIILLPQQMSGAIKHITDDIAAHALCVQHSPTAVALSTSFLRNHAPNSPELNALTTIFKESYSSVSMSRESKTLKNQAGG